MILAGKTDKQPRHSFIDNNDSQRVTEGMGMAESAAQIFRDNTSIDMFRQRVVQLNGEFRFDRDAMIELGEVYFDRYPDSFSNRDCQSVHAGYQIVRICVAEKMFSPIDPKRRNYYRDVFQNLSSLQRTINELITVYGRAIIMDDCSVMSRILKEKNAEIDTIPRGMIKERFIGGISNLYNILYLLQSAVKKHE